MNSNDLQNTLESLFIEDNYWSISARLYDYEKWKYPVYGNSKISLEKLRTHLELIQSEIINYFIFNYPKLNDLWANRKAKLELYPVSLDIYSRIKYLMIQEDIEKYEQNPKIYIIVILFTRNEEKWPILIKKVEIMKNPDIKNDNDNDEERNTSNYYNLSEIN